MNYQQTIEYLFSQLPMYQRIGKAAYKADLSNTLALDKHFGHPHRSFKTIHVAGTNGKGSSSHMLASVLMESGYKTGLYTSPHLRDFRERIKINGEMISEQEVVGFVENSKNVFQQIKPSFFEMTVALAFDFFAKQKVDVAIIEVGLGGRLDSTNIITPELSLITNISLDHTDLLGDTLEKIAIEKAGIIKPNIPVVISQTQSEIEHVFTNKAKELNSPITFADQHYSATPLANADNLKKSYRIEKNGITLFNDLQIDLTGEYQQKNILGVLQSIEILQKNGFNISDISITKGVANAARNTGLMGRWQKLGENPLIICDTGHNIDGINFIINQINSTPHNELHMVLGFVNDKKIDDILTLLPQKARYYFTKASIPRALDEMILAQKANAVGINGETYRSVKEALVAAKRNAKPNDLIFIGGSTFVVADALE